MQLLRTILIIIIVYYLARLFVRYVLPLIARYFIRKAVNKQNEQERAQQHGKEGEIHISYSPDKKDFPDDLGEFIDFEEIDDDKNKEDKKKTKET